MKEPFLEPILRKLRIRKVLPTIRQYPDCCLLDVGCGWDYRLLKTLKQFIKSGIGIDYKVQESESGKIKTIQMIMVNKLPFAAESFDVVTLLAVLEHLSDPLGMMKEIGRILKKDGRLVLTVPSKAAQPVLEFLSYRLKIISADEIRDHKKYYDRNELEKLFSQTGMAIEHHKYFQMGMNNFCIIKRA
jgi:2-polyprenyl-3-methyl-5-hydroxy-6-metoxy-1,4-benzoquinol methylase